MGRGKTGKARLGNGTTLGSSVEGQGFSPAEEAPANAGALAPEVRGVPSWSTEYREETEFMAFLE